MNTDPAPDADAARARLVRSLVAAGDLTDPAWRAAFESVPRHLFVPCFYDHAGRKVSADDATTRAEWFEAVHEDRSLVTHRTDGAATSSSSQPSLMATMLEALRVTDGAGMNVLEIGSGTGYNAALLSHRLGSRHVTTVDTEPELVHAARARLAQAGYSPRVVLADGAQGHTESAPYSRIIATCRINSVPVEWIRQLADGTGDDAGQIVAPLGNALVRIRRTGSLEADGRFLPGGAFFMPLRRTAGDGIPARRPDLPTGEGRPTALPVAAIADNAFRFLVSVIEPGLTWQYDLGQDSKPAAARVWSADGSLACLQSGGTVSETGPRSLWSRLEEAYRVFTEHAEPGPDRYGFTLTAGTQRVWLDTPGGPSWPLRAAP
ncbi:methyltransferase domain-containing protein [Streptomyces sp. MS19]|uniref:methyltransferase domain-containing protein n=1 Tax=Streptomyces sp. MS19 TaxID=3385972 RepID=UPI0039A35D8F